MTQRIALLLVVALATAAPLRAQVVGRVTEEGSGEAIEGVEVSIPATGSRRTTDGEGYFRFPRLQPGSYRLTVQHWAYEPREVQVTAATGMLVQVPVQTRMLRPPPFPPDTRLRVATGAPGGATVVGEIEGIDPDTLLLRLPGSGELRSVPFAAIERLEIRQTEGRPWWGVRRGAVLGALAGMALGPAVDLCFADRSCSGGAQVVVGALFGGGVGGVVGGFLGATLLTAERWIELPFSVAD